MKLFDAHADIGFDVLDKHRQGQRDVLKTDHLDKLSMGDVRGVGMACFFKGDEDWTTAKAMVTTLRDEILANADRVFLTTGEQWDESRINALITIEGMGFLKRDVEKTITWLYDHGVRIASLSWNDENALCTGAKGTPDRGLTLMGKQAVRIMHRLGMAVDLSHTNEKSFWDILAVDQGSVLATHSNARALSNVERNLTDQQLKAIAKRGGLVGLVSAAKFIHPEPGYNTAANLAKHGRYIADLIGVQHLCLGLDYMDFLEGFQRNGIDLDNASQSQNLIEALRGEGFSENELKAIAWDNIIAFLKALPQQKTMPSHHPQFITKTTQL
jgi:membrane dipeptidase